MQHMLSRIFLLFFCCCWRKRYKSIQDSPSSHF